jgi:hypothetical protein
MNKVFLLIVSLLTIFIFSNFVFNITGLSLGSADVNIKDNLVGRITGLYYLPVINITNTQTISTEFTNIGSLPMTARIEEIIYYYNTTKLDPIAYYYDSSVNLMPGMKRFFRTFFMPPNYGSYYIKIRVPYDTKVTETWGFFSVVYYPPTLEPIIVVISPPAAGVTTYIPKELGIPRIYTDYQKEYDMYPGQSTLISISVRNVGEVSLYNLRLTTSTTSLITTDVNPKVLSSLRLNASTLFFISVNIPKDIPTGDYPLNFELISDKITEYGAISLNVTSFEVSIKDDVYKTILNFEYLLNDLERMISDAIAEGLDVKLAQKSFERARENLERARELYDSEDYEGARDMLDEVKKDFEDIVFQLAHAKLKLQVAPAFSPFIIIILAILLAIIFLFILRRRRKEKRPKLLKEISEET